MTRPPHLAKEMALFLDFDGTLVELAHTPGAVAVSDQLIPTLQEVQDHLDGALAVVSGRDVRDIDRFLDPLTLPAAGLHGLQRRLTVGGELEAAKVWPGVAELRQDILLSGILTDGVNLEDKGSALCVHYRAAPDREEEVRARVVEMTARFPSLHAIFGNMVVEAKPTAEDKGTAVRRFLETPAFKGRLPVFIGDDVTDEDGIAAVQALGGYGIKVGAQDSAAFFRLPTVKDVHDWLAQANDIVSLENQRLRSQHDAP
ncbi:trehalose-phosphatase [Pseudovibrio exalbescens]|uniref:trehalose-phosphatase n=1 Tax=Pseudovibrio exalbescens TaxID=197461 RepID=UPI000C9D05A2|nr:trehalose-phosphatase [Pseudovibrio exalbescens]